MGLVSLHQVVNVGSSNAHSHVLFPRMQTEAVSVSCPSVGGWCKDGGALSVFLPCLRNTKNDMQNDRDVNYLTFFGLSNNTWMKRNY